MEHCGSPVPLLETLNLSKLLQTSVFLSLEWGCDSPFSWVLVWTGDTGECPPPQSASPGLVHECLVMGDLLLIFPQPQVPLSPGLGSVAYKMEGPIAVEAPELGGIPWWERGVMEASHPARACGFPSFRSTCVELVCALPKVKWEEEAEDCGDVDWMLAACQVQSLLMLLSYHRHAQLQMGKLRHRVPHLAAGGIQPAKLFLLGLIGCSWDLGLNVTDPEDAERGEKCLMPSWAGPALVLCWGAWAGSGHTGQLEVLLWELAGWRLCWLR